MRDDTDDTEERETRLGFNVFVRLKPATEEAVRRLARADERSVSTMIRRLVEEALAARGERAA